MLHTEVCTHCLRWTLVPIDVMSDGEAARHYFCRNAHCLNSTLG